MKAILLHFLVSSMLQSGQAESIRLDVDLRDAWRSLVHVKEWIGTQPGPLTLVYPKWGPGDHAPVGPIGRIASLRFLVDGKSLAWRRDDMDPFAFSMNSPGGTLEIQFDFIASAKEDHFDLSWSEETFYPKGWTVDATQVQGEVHFPSAWSHASALSLEEPEPGRVSFKAVNLATLVDSPLWFGPRMQRILIKAPGDVPHLLDIFSTREEELVLDPQTLAGLAKLVAESRALFGARHYDHYDFLVRLQPEGRISGLEHHQCTELGSASGVFATANQRSANYLMLAGVMAHEYVHSWIGKYRRPEGLATSDYQEPMRGRLLWVYEGLTEYLGFILASRSGLILPEETRDLFAYAAAREEFQRGRDWRPLEDCTVDPILGREGDLPWRSATRLWDYYHEGALLWLEVDATIRTRSHGRRSLDDFCRAFFGGADSGPVMRPYTYEDLVKSLAEVQPMDWKGFFDLRVRGIGTATPNRALNAAGWRIYWNDKVTKVQECEAEFYEGKGFSTTFGLGARILPDGLIQDLIPGSPAEKGGLAPRMKVLGVNGRVWSLDDFQAAMKMHVPLTLWTALDGELKIHDIDYLGGERHPHLEAIPGAQDLLTSILEPMTR